MAQASAAYISGDYESVLIHAQRASAGGEPLGSTLLGHMYLHGLGTTQSDEMAVIWLERAAELEEPDAMIILSSLAEAGRGGLSSSQTTSFLRQAADTGDIRAAYEYGLHLKERGDPGEARIALDWLRLSADSGYTPAYLEYALALDQWVHGPQSPALALPWYIRASETGRANASLQAGLMLMHGEQGVDSDPARGAQLIKVAAEQQLPSAMGQLALLYFQGAPGLPANSERAVSWAQQGAQMGDPDSQFLFGYALATGEGTMRDLRQAYLWTLRAGQPGPFSLATDPQRQQLEAALERSLNPEIVRDVQAEAAAAGSSF